MAIEAGPSSRRMLEEGNHGSWNTQEWQAAIWVEHTLHRVTAERKEDKPHRAGTLPPKILCQKMAQHEFFRGHPREKLV